MGERSWEDQTTRITGGSAPSGDDGPDSSGGGFSAFFSRVLDRLGFEVRSKDEKKEKTPIGDMPAKAWDGVKKAAANTRSIWLNKAAAFDKPLFIIVMVLVFLGLIMMASASYAYSYSHHGNSMYIINKQLVATVVGLLLMLFISTVHPGFLKGKWSYILWVVSIILLIIVRLLPGSKGVHRWIEIGSLSFQPSELAKFTAILGLGRNFQTAVWPFMWRIVPILVLLVLQPHLSCTIIILLIVGTLMLLAGTRREYFLTLLGFAAVAVYLIVFLGVVPYGRTRVAVWLDPFADAKGNGWQNVQSLYAISSGGIFGAGFGNSRQKYMYISEPQNDFIFSVICEELGLVGAIIIILIFVTFIWRGFSLSVANTDRFQKFVGIGITSQIGYQMMLNIAVVTNMVPNTGISLPFFSSGGTSIVMLLAEIGVLLAISRESPNKVM